MRIFIALGGLLVTLLLATLVVPHFIDWTAFRADFEREASRVLGRTVVVRGEASARLLPFPSLTFSDVVVEGQEGADGAPLMTLDEFSMDAELAPYLSGEIRIFQMRLRAPHLTLPVGVDGQVAVSAAGLPDATVILENVEVAEGRITFVDANGGVRSEISDLSGAFSARTLRGPFSGGGSLVADGEPLGFNVTTGTIEADGAWPVRTTLRSERLSAAVTIDGQTRLGDGTADLNGSLQIVTPLEDSERSGDAVLPPLLVTSRLVVSSEGADLSDARVEVGSTDAPYVLSGTGRIAFAPEPSFDLDLSGEQVDVDAIATGETGGDTPIRLADRLEAVRRTLAAVPDLGIEGTVSLSLPVVTAGDTTIRNTRFVGRPGPESWTISQLSAELPGRTLMEADGQLTVRPGLSFSGDLLVASRQVGGFADWIAGRTPAELAGLDRAGLEARVDLSSERQILENLEVDVGGQRLLGRLERVGSGATGTINADLSGEAVDLDAFLAFAGLLSGEGPTAPALNALDVRFDAGPVSYQDLQAEALGIDFAYADTFLDLRNIVVTGFAGANLEARGTIADLLSDPRPELAFDLSSENPTPLVEVLEQRLPESPLFAYLSSRADRFGPVALTGSLTLPIQDGAPALALRLDGSAAGTTVGLALSLENGLAAATLDGRFGLEASLWSETPFTFLRQLGLKGVDIGLPSPLTATLALSGAAGRATTTSLRISAPDSLATADGTVEFGIQGVQSADLRIAARSADASPWMTGAGLAFGQGFDAVPADLSGRLSWFGGDWAFNAVEGDLAGREIAASLRATRGGGVAGDMSVSSLSLPWLATLVYGRTPIPPMTDADGWPAEPFGPSLVSIRPLQIALSAAELELSDDAVVRDASMQIATEQGSIALSDIDGAFAAGRVGGGVSFANTGGLASVDASLSLAGVQAHGPGGEMMAGPIDGRLSFEGRGRSYAELVASLTGEGAVSVGETGLPGIVPELLPPLLDAATSAEASLDTAAVRSLVELRAMGSTYPAGRLDTDLSVALGQIVLPPLMIKTIPGEVVELAGRFDLRNGRIEADAVQRFQPPEDDVVPETDPLVRYRLEGPVGASFAVADVEPLTGYLTVRRLQREQARLAAIRDDLRETLRLRREVRLYTARAAAREAARLEAEAEERRRIEAEAAEAAAQAERRAAQAAQARQQAAEAREREEAAARDRAAEAAAQAAAAAARATQPPVAAPALDFDLSPPTPSAPAAEALQPPPSYEGLPGVQPPTDF